MTFIVAQLGARRHYAVPRILHSAGLLEHFFTDISVIKGWPRFARFMPERLQPDGLRRLMGRLPQGVPADRVTAFNLLGLRYAYRLRRVRSEAEQLAVNIWAGKNLCKLVSRRGFGVAKGIHVFSSAGLELLQAARMQSRRTTLEQVIAPRRLEISLLREEHEAFPDWQSAYWTDGAAATFCAREEAEWSTADLILCGSEFVREGIARCNGPADRCVVVPYGVAAQADLGPRAPHAGPIRVLVVGTVGLRKGSPYVQAAAAALKNRAVFRMVGSLDILPKVRVALSEVVELIGAVPRSQIAAHLAWADIFLLPSLCEGSAAATYEALAAALPVICTPNTGSVVRDGIDGWIVPIRNADAIVSAVDRLIRDPDRRRVMAESAKRRAAEFDLVSYGKRLVAALCPPAPSGGAA
jgi:glycosyltransferase involved in cell wall biosynthesis